MSRTFGHAGSCPNAKYTVPNADPDKPSRGGAESKFSLSGQRGVFAKRPGKGLATAYSTDARGDCRPSYLKGTGNFTISQASRFPPDKKAPGSEGDYNPGFVDSVAEKTSPPRRTHSPPSKPLKKGENQKPEPDTVGPATYLRHNSRGLDGKYEGKHLIYAGGSGLRSKASRDVYGPGGMSDLGMVSSPKRINCYVAHDHLQEWHKKTPTKQGWATKGRSFSHEDRFRRKSWEVGTPGPGDYYGSLSRPYSSLNTKIQYRDPDATKSHQVQHRPYTGSP